MKSNQFRSSGRRIYYLLCVSFCQLSKDASIFIMAPSALAILLLLIMED